MEAYKVKYGTRVKILEDEVKVPPEAPLVKKGDIIKVLKLDGMYCNGLNEEGVRVYIAAWTEVEKIKN